MRIPSYIGEVICTGLHLGNLPPYIHGMRVLPSDMNDILALEIDIEYCGGVVLDIETRVDVCDKDLAEGLESTSGEEVTSDLLEGFEYIGNQLKLSEGTAEKTEGKEEGSPKLGWYYETFCLEFVCVCVCTYNFLIEKINFIRTIEKLEAEEDKEIVPKWDW